MKIFFKFLFYSIAGVLLLAAAFLTFLYVSSYVKVSDDMALLGREAPNIISGNTSVRDLNKNGRMDVYEDLSAGVNDRVEDLLKQMTLEEKAGLMFIDMAAMEGDGSLSNTRKISVPMSLMFDSNLGMVAQKKMSHFNTIQSLKPLAMIAWYNSMQKLAERTRLGIPITLATDPRHGVPDAPGASIYTPSFSKWCSPIGFAAIGDTTIMREFGNIARQEYLTLGFRLALSPMADLATEPRWARISGTFGEDAEMSARLTKAYILGFQGDTINNLSVECMVKHFAGGGPQENGMDAHFPPGRQAYPGKNFNYHVIPFEKGAFPAQVAQVMPYYGIPVGQTGEDVGFGYNREIVTGMLRDKYHFNGIICTDWALVTDDVFAGITIKPAAAHGVEKLSVSERVAKILNAGCDMFGGEAIPEVVIDLVKSGQISEERINASVRRILKEKFRLGLFDNPYARSEFARSLGNEKSTEKGRESQRRSLVLLKNEKSMLPLAEGKKVYLHGFSAEETRKYAAFTTDLESADVVILKLRTPHDPSVARYTVEKIFFHQGRLDFPPNELEEIMKLIRSKPTVTVINLERPAVIPEISKESQALIADFSSSDDIILDLIYGRFKPSGHLPFELPSSMEAVVQQKEDLPHDSKAPLFPYGFGLAYP